MVSFKRIFFLKVKVKKCRKTGQEQGFTHGKSMKGACGGAKWQLFHLQSEKGLFLKAEGFKSGHDSIQSLGFFPSFQQVCLAL